MGDIMKVQTSGASPKTAQQDNLGYSGVQASNKMAEIDKDRMNTLRSKIKSVGSQCNIAPALIAGIISRESRAGNTIQNSGGWGDNGNAFGLMQVDKNWHTPVGTWNSEEHLRQATEILVHFIGVMSNKWKDCTPEQKLKGGIAAYNMGDGNVHTYDRVDENTTGKDYSNDVVARAQWFKKNCGF